MDRAHRAVVAGVHRLEQVEGLRPAHLADDDPFRSHAQAVPDEIAHGDLALALEIGRAGLETHHMGLLQLKLGGVLAGDHPLLGIDEAGQAVEQRRLAGPVPPEINTLQRTRPMMPRRLHLRGDRAELDEQVGHFQAVAAELADGEGRAVDRQRRHDDVDA